MDIKENFYSKLQQIREGMDELPRPRQLDALEKMRDANVTKKVNTLSGIKKTLDDTDKALNVYGVKSSSSDSNKIQGQIDSIRKTRPVNEITYQKARKAEDKAAEVYHKDYDDETDARRKYMRDKTPESKKEAEEAGKKRKKSAKRVIRFQNYADKKKDK
jgi:hypothetical protein